MLKRNSIRYFLFLLSFLSLFTFFLRNPQKSLAVGQQCFACPEVITDYNAIKRQCIGNALTACEIAVFPSMKKWTACNGGAIITEVIKIALKAIPGLGNFMPGTNGKAFDCFDSTLKFIDEAGINLKYEELRTCVKNSTTVDITVSESEFSVVLRIFLATLNNPALEAKWKSLFKILKFSDKARQIPIITNKLVPVPVSFACPYQIEACDYSKNVCVEKCGPADPNKNSTECKCTRGELLAENGQPVPGTYTALGCVPKDINRLIAWVLQLAIGLGGGIAFLLMIFGAFQVILSGGDPEKLNSGKEIITSAVAGLLMIIFSVVLLKIIGYDILRIPGLTLK